MFAWLLVVDRLNTKDMLTRRNLNYQDNVYCVAEVFTSKGQSNKKQNVLT
jgi:hypothetical protein